MKQYRLNVYENMEGVVQEEYLDLAHWVQHRINCGRLFDHKQEKEYINLKFDYLAEIFGNELTKKGLDYLKAKGYLISDNCFVVGSKAYGYKWHNEDKVSRVYTKSDKFSSRMREMQRKEYHRFTKTYRQLVLWLKELDIDTVKANEYIESLKDISNHKYNCYKSSIMLLEDNNFLYKKCKYGRLHTNLTSLYHNLRFYISYKSNPLYSLDISNSQLVFFIHTSLSLISNIKSPILKSIYSSNTSYINYNNDTKNINVSSSKNSILEQMELSVMRGKFFKLIAEGKVYEYFMQKCQWTKTRGEFKTTFFRLFYGSFNLSPLEGKDEYGHDEQKRQEYISELKLIKKVWKEEFPLEYDLIHALKGKNPEELPREMQRVESKFIIETVCGRLIEERPDMPIWTIHDSICSTKENMDYIKSVLMDEFSKAGIQATVKLDGYEGEPV